MTKIENPFSVYTLELLKFSKCLCDKKLKFINCSNCKRKYTKFYDIVGFFYENAKSDKTMKKKLCILNSIDIKCDEPAIDSHTISNKSHLSKLIKNSNDSIYTLNKENLHILRNDNIPEFTPVKSLKNTSTFHGLCKTHDSIYNPIDTNFDHTNRNHILLLGHRQNLYELYKRIEMIETLTNIKQFLDSLKITKLNEKNRKIFSKIYNKIIADIEFHEKIRKKNTCNINLFKNEFEIALKKTGYANFKDNANSNFIYSVIQFEKQLDFTFSSNFVLKYDFKENLIYPQLNTSNYILQEPSIGVINDKNFSYFYCICINNKENIQFIKSLTKAVKENINTLLKCALMNDNSYFSEGFIKLCKSMKTPQIIQQSGFPFETVDKLLGYVYGADNILYKIKVMQDNEIHDGELLRIKSINSLDSLNLIKPNKIIDIFNNFNYS
jgi:hypothetical protein